MGKRFIDVFNEFVAVRSFHYISTPAMFQMRNFAHLNIAGVDKEYVVKTSDRNKLSEIRSIYELPATPMTHRHKMHETVRPIALSATYEGCRFTFQLITFAELFRGSRSTQIFEATWTCRQVVSLVPRELSQSFRRG